MIIIACLCLCFLYYIMRSRPRASCQQQRRHNRANVQKMTPQLLNDFDYSPDPLNRIGDMAKDGVSFDQIKNNEIAFVR